MATHSTSTASDRGAAAARKKTMLAGRLHFAPRRFAVEEVPVPGPGEVLVAVKAAGVCLSDVHLIDGSLSPVFNRNPAVTLGHEVAGVIEAIGPDVTGWELGQRAVLQAGQSCGSCTNCRRWMSPCLAIRTRGVDYDGGWAEYALARQERMTPAVIPRAVLS